jgi:integrase
VAIWRTTIVMWWLVPTARQVMGLPGPGPLILLALTTGMREGEICALRWTDLDLTVGEATIQQTVWWPSRRSRGLEPLPQRTWAERSAQAEFRFKPRTKNGRARKVPILEPVLPWLTDHRRHQLELRLRNASVWEDFGLVFTDERGRPLRQDRVRNNLKRILTKAGLPSIRFHDLRHSTASILLALGIPILDVAAILGHTTPTLTLRLYGHLMPGAQKDAARRLEGALFGQPKEKRRKESRPR